MTAVRKDDNLNTNNMNHGGTLVHHSINCFIWSDHKTNTDIAKELNIITVLDKIQEKLDTTRKSNST
jgi:hypothetical protein